MKKHVQRAMLAVLTLMALTLGVVVWDTRPIAAQEPPMDPSYSAWCRRVHHELFSMLPAAVQQEIIAMHASHSR
jgi:hypothetical protein